MGGNAVTDFERGRLFDCDTCGRPVRLYGHNDVISWTCLPCREKRIPTLLESQDTLTETAEYDPAIAEIPY